MRKVLLDERTQCFHLEFTAEIAEPLTFTAGQFLSLVAEDARGKQQTRAYSLASAPRGREFDVCVNRVEAGFFSNLLCDLEPGATVQFHGPHGFFVLEERGAHALFLAADTGIAPIRGIVEWLFPQGGPARAGEQEYWLVYGADREAEILYRDFLEEVAREHPNFHPVAVLADPEVDWPGEQGTVAEAVVQLIAAEPRLQATAEASAPFPVYAYICGLNAMVAPTRAKLLELGWHRKQLIVERYD